MLLWPFLEDQGWSITLLPVGAGPVNYALDALLRLGNQDVALAKLRGTRGTNFGARCLLPLRDTVRTHDAFLYFREQFPPLIFRNAEGARDHAVTASHALGWIVSDRPQSGLLESADRANRSARRILAVHAEPAHELVIPGKNAGQLVCGLKLLAGDGVVVGEVISHGASLLALLAADADRGII